MDRWTILSYIGAVITVIITIAGQSSGLSFLITVLLLLNVWRQKAKGAMTTDHLIALTIAVTASGIGTLQDIIQSLLHTS